MDQNLAKFLADAKVLIDDWKSIDVRVVATHQREKWVYGAIRLELSPDPVSEPPAENLPTIDGLLVAHERLGIDRLESVLESLSNGILNVRGNEIEVKDPTNPPMWFLYYRPRLQDFQTGGTYRSSLYVQHTTIMAVAENGDLVDSMLRSCSHPWDGLPDLIRNFVCISPNLSSPFNTSRVLEIAAPIALRIAQASLVESRKASLKVEIGPSVSVSSVIVSFIGFLSDGSQTRIRKTGQVDEATRLLSFELEFPASVLRVVAVLTYHEFDLARVELFGKAPVGINPRLIVLQAEPLQNFLDSLRAEKDKSFENRVSLLFHILGLSPGYYGRMYTDNSDILVFPESNDWAFNVECTEKNIDLNNKLSKLATRTRVLAATMAGVEVYPVLLTKFPRFLVLQSDMEKAAAEGISVVTSSEFEPLIQMAIEGRGPNQVRDYILSLRP